MQNKAKDVLYCGVDKEKIAKANPVLGTESLEAFIHWIEERYKVHLKKDVEHLPSPWTEDKIIANYRFTNVRREQDRQTKYLIDNIVNNKKLKLEEKVLNCILFRYWNLWDTMKSFGGPWTKKKIIDGSALRVATKEYDRIVKEKYRHNFFTSAFLVSGLKAASRRNFNNSNAVLNAFEVAKFALDHNIPKRCINAVDQAEVVTILREIPGIAGFLSYQIFVDCTYIPEFPFSENEFTVAGPGCRKGLRALFKDTDNLTPEECIFWLRDNIEKIAPQFKPMNFMTDLPEDERHMTVMSLENCLCEFSKYARSIFGKGRPRKHYIPYKES